MTPAQLALPPQALPALGLGLDVLDEVLKAIGDREDHVGPEARERLAAARRRLDAEAALLIPA